jgi:hypothetical protein
MQVVVSDPVLQAATEEVARNAAITSAAASQAAATSNVIGLITIIVQTLGGVALAWLAYKTAALNKNQVAINKTQNEIKDTMVVLEKNTNSIKDELVAATAEANFAAGRKHEIDLVIKQGDIEQAMRMLKSDTGKSKSKSKSGVVNPRKNKVKKNG